MDITKYLTTLGSYIDKQNHCETIDIDAANKQLRFSDLSGNEDYRRHQTLAFDFTATPTVTVTTEHSFVCPKSPNIQKIATKLGCTYETDAHVADISCFDHSKTMTLPSKLTPEALHKIDRDLLEQSNQLFRAKTTAFEKWLR